MERKNAPRLRLRWWFKHIRWKCEQNEWIFWGLRVQGAKIGLKINVKKTKSLRLGISEDEQVTLGNEKIDQGG